jgi:hypothetical protein
MVVRATSRNPYWTSIITDRTDPSIGTDGEHAATFRPDLAQPEETARCLADASYVRSAVRTRLRSNLTLGGRRGPYFGGVGLLAGGVGLLAGGLSPCLVSRFSWRHSERLFSSPALQACFCARESWRLSRLSSRRSPPEVCAYVVAVTIKPAPASNAKAVRTGILCVIFRPPHVIREAHSSQPGNSGSRLWLRFHFYCSGPPAPSCSRAPITRRGEAVRAISSS